MDWFKIFPWFFGYLLTGYYLDKYEDKIKISNLVIVLFILVLTLVGVYLNYFACQVLNIKNDYFVFNTVGVIVFLRCSAVFYLIRKNFHSIKSSKGITAISGASFGVYLIHPFITDIIKDFFTNSVHGVFYMISLIMMVLVFSFLSIHLIRKFSISKHIM